MLQKESSNSWFLSIPASAASPPGLQAMGLWQGHKRSSHSTSGLARENKSDWDTTGTWWGGGEVTQAAWRPRQFQAELFKLSKMKKNWHGNSVNTIVVRTRGREKMQNIHTHKGNELYLEEMEENAPWMFCAKEILHKIYLGHYLKHDLCLHL